MVVFLIERVGPSKSNERVLFAVTHTYIHSPARLVLVCRSGGGGGGSVAYVVPATVT